MTKYRIVEVKIPKLMYDDITIEYVYMYDIERQVSIFLGLGKSWVKDRSYRSYYKLEHAKARLKFLKEEETRTVIDVD